MHEHCHCADCRIDHLHEQMKELKNHIDKGFMALTILITIQGENMSVELDALTAATARISAEVGETAAVVDTLRAAVDALTAQVAQGQLDAAAVTDIANQLTAAADTLDAQGNDAAPAPVA